MSDVCRGGPAKLVFTGEPGAITGIGLAGVRLALEVVAWLKKNNEKIATRLRATPVILFMITFRRG